MLDIGCAAALFSPRDSTLTLRVMMGVKISSDIWMVKVRARVQCSFARKPQSMTVDIWHNVSNETP